MKEIALIGQYELSGNIYPAAKILNEQQNVAFDPVFVAGSIVSLYEAFLAHVPESSQIEFEETFKNTLMLMFNSKEEYMVTFKDNE